MSEDYNDDAAREAARYLHFEYENPTIADVQFDSITEAINWIMSQGWGPESWFKRYGMIEEKIRVLDANLDYRGDLIRIREGVMFVRDGQHQTLRDIDFGTRS